MSERFKTILVTVVMLVLVGGMLWGYYAAYQWKAERGEFKSQTIEQILQEEIVATPPW